MLIRRLPQTALFHSRAFSTLENTFMASDLKVFPPATLKTKPGPDHQYTFGGITTDYMLDIDYDKNNGGWQKPKIVANAPFHLDPANATLHYAIECFEGAKAYRTVDGRIVMFRCDENFKRLNSSHKQLGIPEFNVEQMLECCR
jgi:branched-chain amino acid aminotransferase